MDGVDTGTIALGITLAIYLAFILIILYGALWAWASMKGNS